MSDDSPDSPDYNNRTDTVKERMFADIIAGIIVFSLPIFIGVILLGYGATSVGVVWLTIYSLILTMSATRLYGKGVLSSAADVVKSIVKK